MVLSKFDKIVRDIKSLKIQGANAVARESLNALMDIAEQNSSASTNELRDLLEKGRKELFATRPTEPFMRNAINFVVYSAKGRDARTYHESVISFIQEGLKQLRDANKNIAEIGANKIRNGMVVCTHCHSSTVIAILAEAWKQGKRFEVHNTETRPKFQGRMTASDLAKLGIPVTHYVDSGIRYSLHHADLVLIGTDALTVEGNVINKIGSGLIGEIAHKYDIPMYSCTHSWKFDPLTIFGYDEEIEERDLKEVWPEAPKGVTVRNPAFESVNPNLITGVISELGVYKPELLVEELKSNKWMFRR